MAVTNLSIVVPLVTVDVITSLDSKSWRAWVRGNNWPRLSVVMRGTDADHGLVHFVTYCCSNNI